MTATEDENENGYKDDNGDGLNLHYDGPLNEFDVDIGLGYMVECKNSNCFDMIESDFDKHKVSIHLNDMEKTTYTISVCSIGCQRDILERFMKEYA